MIQLNENLLHTWLRLSTTIVNDRVVEGLSYNEALVCNILVSEKMKNPEKKMTATDLCFRTKMLKSQMNRTLTQLEIKGIICRQRSKQDRRQVFVSMNMDQAGTYQKLHDKVLNLVDAIIERIGEEKALQAVQLFDDIASAADTLLNPEEIVIE